MEMASAAMIHFGLDHGKIVHFLSGKYTSQYWGVHCTLDAVWDHVTSDDYNHIKQILLDGYPAQLTFKEPSSNKLEFISQGNFKSFAKNLQLVQKNIALGLLADLKETREVLHKRVLSWGHKYYKVVLYYKWLKGVVVVGVIVVGVYRKYIR